jgi:histidinol-phosphate aminotransferase
MAPLVRPQIDGIIEYTLRQYPHRIKLNQNENPYELPTEIKREILERMAAEHWSRYPPFVPERQMEKVAVFTGWKPDGVLLGNGSNDLLQLLFTCVLDAGRSVVINQPTFTLYKLLAQSLGGAIHEVMMKRPFAFDVDAIIETARRSQAAMVVLCSPNNPTGTTLKNIEIERILESTEGLVVVDEAYVHFSDETITSELSRLRRLVVLQTFSKAMGAAGLRFGYALLDPALARELKKVKLPYSVNIFTLTAAEVLMDRWNDVKKWITDLKSERERVRNAMKDIAGIIVYPSAANFILFETTEKPPAAVFDSLLADGILIRNVSSYPMLERGLRVSIGTPSENTEFLDALRKAV